MAKIPGGGKAKFGSAAFNAAHGVGQKKAGAKKAPPAFLKGKGGKK